MITKANNVSLFLDLSNIKFTIQVQEYNPTDDAIPLKLLVFSTQAWTLVLAEGWVTFFPCPENM